jgi:hypothetical protein
VPWGIKTRRKATSPPATLEGTENVPKRAAAAAETTWPVLKTTRSIIKTPTNGNDEARVITALLE